MNNLANIGTVKNLCRKYGFSFSKSLGQNFLVDPNICPRIAELSGTDKSSGVIEIGAGFGVLTTELCKRSKKVVSIEIDQKLKPVLTETLQEFDNLKIIYADVLKLDLKKLIEEEFNNMQVFICANLPYYVTSPILMSILEQKLPIKSITVMVQKETADRLCAEMGTRKCGAVTAAVCYYSKPQLLFNVSRDSFLPRPNVDSSVIQLNVKSQTPAGVVNETFLFRIIKLAFSQRRKMLANPLSSGLHLTKASIIAALASVHLKPTSRAEELTLPEFIALSNAILKEVKQNG